MLPSVQAREVVEKVHVRVKDKETGWHRSRNKYSGNKAVNVLILKIDSKLCCFF